MSAIKINSAGQCLVFFTITSKGVTFESARLLRTKRNGKTAMRAVMRINAAPARDRWRACWEMPINGLREAIPAIAESINRNLVMLPSRANLKVKP